MNKTYNGQHQLPVANITNIVDDEDVCAIVGDQDSQRNCGNYNSKVVGLGGNDAMNYRLPEDIISTDWTIEQLEVLPI